MKEEQNHDLFSQQLKTLWTVETMLVEYLPLLLERANNPGLTKTLALHFAETKQHKVTIEAICKQLDIYPRQGGYVDDIKKIIDSSEEKTGEFQEMGTGDDAIISTAIEIEEYEIMVYEQAAIHAALLNHQWIAKRLYLTREEEKQSYNKLQFLKTQLVEQTAEIGQH